MVYLGTGVAMLILVPTLRSCQAECWSVETKGYEHVLKALCVIILLGIVAIAWPLVFIGPLTKQMRERKLQKQAEIYGMKFGGGLTLETAIVIVGENNFFGVMEERNWLRNRYPGHRFISQAVFHKDVHVYDKMEIETKSGEHKTVYFNITNFFGV